MTTATTSGPEALLSHLHSADGSATFSYAGYTIVGAVNGPIEAQRRDELPEEALVDVVVRPAAGVGDNYHPDIKQAPACMRLLMTVC